MGCRFNEIHRTISKLELASLPSPSNPSSRPMSGLLRLRAAARPMSTIAFGRTTPSNTMRVVGATESHAPPKAAAGVARKVLRPASSMFKAGVGATESHALPVSRMQLKAPKL